MKKALAIILAALICIDFAACGAEPEQPAVGNETTTAAETEATTAAETQSALPRLFINNEPYVVTAKDGFDNAGVTAFICDATETYSFKASSKETTWKVFVLDEEFTDGARYLAQAQTPALEGDGTLKIEAGKFIYIMCSESVFSADAASDATLTINYAGEADAAPAETTAAETQSTRSKLIINSEPCVITAKDGFDNAGVTALVCDATATYSFKASSAATTWEIYVLDEEFTDGARYLAQAEQPALQGDGTLRIEAGKFVYILCSESAFTAASPSDATLTIDYAE